MNSKPFAICILTSHRKQVQYDIKTCMKLARRMNRLPVFCHLAKHKMINRKIYNTTVNKNLEALLNLCLAM